MFPRITQICRSHKSCSHFTQNKKHGLSFQKPSTGDRSWSSLAGGIADQGVSIIDPLTRRLNRHRCQSSPAGIINFTTHQISGILMVTEWCTSTADWLVSGFLWSLSLVKHDPGAKGNGQDRRRSFCLLGPNYFSSVWNLVISWPLPAVELMGDGFSHIIWMQTKSFKIIAASLHLLPGRWKYKVAAGLVSSLTSLLESSCRDFHT